jgi:Luciferase
MPNDEEPKMAATERTTAEPTASERITETVTSWPGVTAGPGRRGEFAFRVGRREIGHLHGNHAAHFNFPKTVWAELMAQRRIESHPVFPDSRGPAARRITNDDDVADVLVLMRLNYDRLSGGDASTATELGADR